MLFLALLYSSPAVFAQLKPDSQESKISFTVKNFGLHVHGTVSGIEGTIAFKPEDPAAAHFVVTLKSATVKTGNDSRDKHLSKEEYFDAAKFPSIRLESTSVKAGDKGKFLLAGKLTIKGHSKDVSIPFSAVQKGKGFVFDGECSINRKDFGVGGSSTISDNVDISIHVLAE